MQDFGSRRPAAVSFGRALLGGVAAGVVAALAALAVRAALHAPIPPPTPAAGSAFAAGVLAGVVYFAWSRITRRPAAWLWATGLALATAVSAVERLLPPARLPLPRSLFFLSGLASPLGQVLAAIGLLPHASPPPHRPAPSPAQLAAMQHAMSGFQASATTMHYAVAVAAALVVPWVAGAGRRARSAAAR